MVECPRVCLLIQPVLWISFLSTTCGQCRALVYHSTSPQMHTIFFLGQCERCSFSCVSCHGHSSCLAVMWGCIINFQCVLCFEYNMHLCRPLRRLYANMVTFEFSRRNFLSLYMCFCVQIVATRWKYWCLCVSVFLHILNYGGTLVLAARLCLLCDLDCEGLLYSTPNTYVGKNKSV